MPEQENAKDNQDVQEGWRESVESILVTAILALFLISFVVQAFEIPSSSMTNTFLVGDRLLANKVSFAGESGDGFGLLPYRPVERGDVIIFKFPADSTHIHYVKRVIGVPGDRIRIADRVVYVNGEPLDEPYKHLSNSFSGSNFRDNFPPSASLSYDYRSREMFPEVERYVEGDELVVPDGEYFALGDNRDNSQDGRYWGFVHRRNIVARPLVKFFRFSWFGRGKK